MGFPLVMIEFLEWHYTVGIRRLLEAWGNLHWHLFYYFSIPLLSRSFFAPFHRMQEEKKRGFDPQNMLEIVVINTAMRLVGMIIRSVLIVAGLIAEMALLLGGVSFFVLSLAAPLVAAVLLVLGVLQLTRFI